jgi:hypothetical protein
MMEAMASVRNNPKFKTEMGLPANTRGWQRETARIGRAAIQRRAPRRFGTLGGTIYTRVEYRDGTTVVRFVSPVKYATWQEVGTGIYGPLKRYITPRRAQYLSWVDTKKSPGRPGGPEPLGPRRFAKRVKGTPATKFMYRGLVDVFGEAQTRSWAATGGKPGT